ncbi:DUF6011 domain-containing protein [Streptomyces somaliensis]|uniref:DUF6011 domain-containing protein n=1 Tax=Streptomyces somaliensis TaxID=78355 RepID=UPI0020CC9AC3|nr:DUF6011 domain-containing protein [Streptomyces somaliensis]MCP9946686.1 DUF6011 domain-containing protein [Streptomyces somaliensis]MCP9963734.1 DUF6011 domain-containing protein [Streptomyces somaliensis]MCP9972943.1 DUF6011 domain-containing protein [Streptomyces somaliensis]
MNDEPLPHRAAEPPAAEPPAAEPPAAEPPERPPVRCRLCGRPLTGRASRRTGLGPACDAKLHPSRPDVRPRRHEVEQEGLF